MSYFCCCECGESFDDIGDLRYHHAIWGHEGDCGDREVRCVVCGGKDWGHQYTRSHPFTPPLELPGP